MADLLHSVGENYYYVNKIVQNKIELQKLAVVESAADVAGKLVLFTILSIFALIVFVMGLVGLIVHLSTALGSMLYSLGVVSAVLVLLMVIIFSMKERLFIRPVRMFFHSLVTQID